MGGRGSTMGLTGGCGDGQEGGRDGPKGCGNGPKRCRNGPKGCKDGHRGCRDNTEGCRGAPEGCRDDHKGHGDVPEDVGLVTRSAGVTRNAETVTSAAGKVPGEAGKGMRETGTVPKNTGMVLRDAGVVARGAGTIPRGAGTIPGDTGVAMGDTGTGPRDAGMLRRDAEVVPGDAGMIPQGASIPWGLLSQHPGHPRDSSHFAFWQHPAGSRCCTCTQGRLLDVEPWPLQQLRARVPRAARPAGPFPAPKSFGWVEEKGWAGIRPQHRVCGCKKSPKTSPLGSFRLPSGRAFCLSGLSPPPRVGLGVSDTPGGGMQGLLDGRGLGFDNKGKTRAGRGAGDGALQDALRDPNPFNTRASVSSRARLPEKIRLFPARPPEQGLES